MATADHQASVQAYIDHQRKAGLTNEQIGMDLMRSGWSLEHVNAALGTGIPAPATSVSNSMTAQTGNAGMPLQVENVQYNMKMKPVQSKIGLYIKIASTSLWFTVVFVCAFLATVIQKVAGNSGDLGSSFVLTLSLAVVTTPIFLVAYSKFRAEERKNPISRDDIFLKQSVRKGLWGAVVLGAIASVIALYQVLGATFLKESSASYATGFSALVFALGFGSLVYFYWGLHAKTQR